MNKVLLFAALAVLFCLPSSTQAQCSKCWFPEALLQEQAYTVIQLDYPNHPTEITVGKGVVKALRQMRIGFDRKKLGAYIIYYGPNGTEKATVCITGNPPDNINKKTVFFLGPNGQVFVKTEEYSGNTYIYQIVANQPYFITKK